MKRAPETEHDDVTQHCDFILKRGEDGTFYIMCILPQQKDWKKENQQKTYIQIT